MATEPTGVTRWPLQTAFSPAVIAPVLNPFSVFRFARRRARKAKNEKKKNRSAEG
jgi:hypothetical protein